MSSDIQSSAPETYLGARVAAALAQHFLDRFADTIILRKERVDNEKAIRELEENKDFEISKANISRIEMKKWGKWAGGYLRISEEGGVETKIQIGTHLHNAGFEYLRGLMEAACPGIVSMKD